MHSGHSSEGPENEPCVPSTPAVSAQGRGFEHVDSQSDRFRCSWSSELTVTGSEQKQLNVRNTTLGRAQLPNNSTVEDKPYSPQ